MPEKFFCCLPLNVGYVITGITCWVGVAVGIFLTVRPSKDIVLQMYESVFLMSTGSLLLVAYAIPALTWLVSLFVKGVYYLHTFAIAFLFFPLLVQSWIIA